MRSLPNHNRGLCVCLYAGGAFTCTLNAVGLAPARVRVWRCEGRPPLPHHFVCVEKFTLPLLCPYKA